MPKPQTSDTLLSPAEAAHLLGVSSRTLARWTEEYQLPVIVLPSGHRRYRPQDIDALRQPKKASA